MVDGLPGQFDAGGIDLGHLRGEAVASETKAVCAKGVGFKNLGARLEVILMNREDEVGVRQVQFVVAAVDEDTAGVEHCAHRAIGEHGAAGEDIGKLSHLSSMLSHGLGNVCDCAANGALKGSECATS